MRKNLVTAILMTAVTTVLLGLVYPLLMTALAQMIFPRQANGSLIVKNGQAVGSHLIGQPFTGPGYFHSRPSAAGSGYDGANSGGTNLGPTNRALIERVNQQASALGGEGQSPLVPIDLVTTSASGLDPDITPSAAEFQIPRLARERNLSEDQVRTLVARHTEARQLGFLGEPRISILELNLELLGAHSNSK